MANSHRFLIGPPLFVISLFCFGLVLMQPHPSTQAKTTASNHSSLPVSKTQASLSDTSQASLQKLSQEPVITAQSSTATAVSNPAVTSTLSTTATSQASNAGAGAVTSLQAASPNNQTASNKTQVLKTTVTNIVNALKIIK